MRPGQTDWHQLLEDLMQGGMRVLLRPSTCQEWGAVGHGLDLFCLTDAVCVTGLRLQGWEA